MFAQAWENDATNRLMPLTCKEVLVVEDEIEGRLASRQVKAPLLMVVPVLWVDRLNVKLQYNTIVLFQLSYISVLFVK